jgi:hypothetical protein
MAKIEPIKSTPAAQNTGNAQNFTNKLMPPGEYRGKIIDIGFASDQNKTRNILYVALARTDKEDISPRVIRARFDVWSPNVQTYQYAITNLFYFQKAIGLDADLDTEDPKLLDILIKATLFKDIIFIVEKIVSQQGHSFNVVKHFKELEVSPSQPVVQSERSAPTGVLVSNSTSVSGAVASTPAPDNWIDDDVPF